VPHAVEGVAEQHLDVGTDPAVLGGRGPAEVLEIDDEHGAVGRQLLAVLGGHIGSPPVGGIESLFRARKGRCPPTDSYAVM
jgi:hypothetical protein